MLIFTNFKYITISFNGPLFHFLRGIGRPRPRAYNVLSLSRGYKTFLNKYIGGIKCNYGKRIRNIRYLKASLEQQYIQNKIEGFIAEIVIICRTCCRLLLQKQLQLLHQAQQRLKCFLNKIRRDSVKYGKYRNSCQWQ